ncbi:hypothetical protein CHUAL_012577 [Chamberlinius hualienensis]
MGKLNILFLLVVCSSWIYVLSLKFVEEPSDTEAPAGSDVVLKCIFDSYAENLCHWSFNGSTVAIGVGRYHFIGNTTAGDCSLKITNLTMNEVGYWMCEFQKSSFGNEPLTSRAAWLSISAGGLSNGAIAGIVIGCVLAVVIIGALVFYFIKKSKANKDRGDYKVKGEYTRGKPKSHSEIQIESQH